LLLALDYGDFIFVENELMLGKVSLGPCLGRSDDCDRIFL